MKIVVYIQSSNNKINSMSLEALAAAQQIKNKTAGELHVIIFDNNLSSNLKPYNCDSVVCINDSNLTDYNPLYFIETFNCVKKPQ